MFLGHFGPAYLIKAINPDLPLWLLLLATQMIDTIYIVLSLLGIESSVYVPDLKSAFPYHGYTDWSHSLFVGVVLAATVVIFIYGIFCHQKPTLRRIFWLNVAAASHFFLDVLVHEPHLPIVTPYILDYFGVSSDGLPVLGFSWWTLYPTQAFHQTLEATICVGSFLILILSQWSKMQKSLGWILNVVFTLLIALIIPYQSIVDELAGKGFLVLEKKVLFLLMIGVQVVFALLGRWTDSYFIAPKRQGTQKKAKSD